MKQFFFSSFPREDLRKWLSYVCRSRDHSLSHEISLSHQTSSSALSRTAHCFSRTPKLCTECSSFSVFFLLLAFINQRTGTNTVFPLLFCLIVYVLLDFFTVVCLWWFEKTWLSNHLLQNLQTGLDHRSICSASTVVVAVDVLEFCRHRHTLEGCRNCCYCCCCCRNLPVFFLPRNTRDHHTTGDPRFSFLPAGVTHGFSPLGARARSLELELVVALVSSGRTRFFAEKHRHSL